MLISIMFLPLRFFLISLFCRPFLFPLSKVNQLSPVLSPLLSTFLLHSFIPSPTSSMFFCFPSFSVLPTFPLPPFPLVSSLLCFPPYPLPFSLRPSFQLLPFFLLPPSSIPTFHLSFPFPFLFSSIPLIVICCPFSTVCTSLPLFPHFSLPPAFLPFSFCPSVFPSPSLTVTSLPGFSYLPSSLVLCVFFRSLSYPRGFLPSSLTHTSLQCCFPSPYPSFSVLPLLFCLSSILYHTHFSSMRGFPFACLSSFTFSISLQFPFF